VNVDRVTKALKEKGIKDSDGVKKYLKDAGMDDFERQQVLDELVFQGFFSLKTPKISSRSQSVTKTRRADKDVTQLDQEGDQGAPGLYSTAELPQTGHEDALDDGQQVYALATIAAVAREVSKAGDKILARRLFAVAREAREGLKAMGIVEPAFNNPHLYSTAPMSMPGQDGTALDDDNQPHPLEFFGADAPKKGEAGPEPRSGVSAKKKQANATVGDEVEEMDMHVVDEPDTDYTRESFDEIIHKYTKEVDPNNEMTIKDAVNKLDNQVQQKLIGELSSFKYDDQDYDEHNIPSPKKSSKQASRRADPLPQFKDKVEGFLGS